MCNQRGIGEHIFGQSALKIGETSRTSVHFVTDGEFGDAFAHRVYDPGEIHTQYRGQGRRQWQIRPHRPDHGINCVYAAGRNADDNMAGCDGRLGQLCGIEFCILSVGGDCHGFHSAVPSCCFL